MDKDEMIPALEFCTHHHIELSFISALQQSGLIEIIEVEQQLHVPVEQLPHIEKMARLYYEMDINVEGIETITYLLQHMNAMQRKIEQLNARLSIYEQAE